MLGPHANVYNSDVPMPNHSRDSSVEEPVIDGAFGGAFTEPAMDIAGTQSGRPASVEVADDEGGAHCCDATPPAGSGKRAVREEGGSRGGQSKAKAKERMSEWTDKESMALVRLLFEEDCAQQSRRGRQKIRSRREKYDRIIGKMVEQGFPKCDMEDCEAKYYALLDKAKKIRDYNGESGKPSYWDMSRSEKKENGLPLTYEKHMFDALQWKLGKADGSCEDLMQSVNLQRGQTSTITDDEDTGGTSENEGGRRKADTDSAEGYKSRRTAGVSGHKRRSAAESSSDASRGGSFADIAHALVDANDRQAERIAGSFAQAMDGMNKTMAEGNQTLRLIEQAHELACKRGVLFTRVSAMVEELQRVQGEMEKANMREGLPMSRAEAAERQVASLREEVARLQHQLSLYEGGSDHTPLKPDSFITTLQNPDRMRGGTVASGTVSSGSHAT
ncbi:hypothetical protein CBR_g21304 [Chara braunii]|uniref:Myb-like domain-containing protein n=1 Tax=Chara braunii TaxID=69332 RepID=A0A388L161_CHABU|nr:hypothetical protein CBR_g21304 [Chara braunii]|eukprot:GBG76064.1 hypothetical protein CBR_g21304 [Chara braunii]